MSILSNYDIYDIFKKLKLPIVCCCRDELDKYKTQKHFIINYSYSFDGTNGSHWVALYLGDDKTAYYSDSFGRKPIDEVIKFCKKLKYEEIIYNNDDIQSKKSLDCGWYSSSFIHFMKEQNDIETYIDMFSDNTTKNDNILIKYFKKLIK